MEIVIALVLLMLVGNIMLTILTSSRRTTTETRAQVARQMTLRTLTETIDADLDRTSFTATTPGGLIDPAANGTGARLELIDSRRVSYYLDRGVVYREEHPAGGNRPVAQDVAVLEFTADPSMRTITVRVTPIGPDGTPSNAFAVEMTRLVRNP